MFYLLVYTPFENKSFTITPYSQIQIRIYFALREFPKAVEIAAPCEAAIRTVIIAS